MSCFRVDRESVAEQAGLQVGDLILDVNGTSFESIPHQEAVDFVKSQQHIIMTVKVCINSAASVETIFDLVVFFCL
jgi:C-terminal processing protease CtpA/Prc